ncbi:MAG: hypothetical protein IH628_05220, partial [Proteobacteria bacterium]|nr:hypothetical protein [Pseudomonadota bacterium]
MDTVLEALTTHLKEQEEAMHDALRRLVLIPSGTDNKAGVDAVCREVYDLLDGLPLERRILPQERYGDMLVASVPPVERTPRILLAGHMDTIFPVDSAFRGWREDESNFYGPGVVDMKGGDRRRHLCPQGPQYPGAPQGSPRHLGLQLRGGGRFAGLPGAVHG